jgi:hypothetical protein
MPVHEKTATKPKASAGRISAENSLFKFLANKTPETAVSVLSACAASGDDCWISMLDRDMAIRISQNASLMSKLVMNLCKQPGMPYADIILDCFLSFLPVESVQALFSGPQIKKRSHPAVTCFYNASFPSPSGINLTQVLAILVKHGLPIETIALKNITDMERAASYGHRNFLVLVVPRLTGVPDEIIKAAMIKSIYPVTSISILVDDCKLPLSLFSQQRFLLLAKPEARSYINARLSRNDRIPEIVYSDNDMSDDIYGD